VAHRNAPVPAHRHVELAGSLTDSLDLVEGRPAAGHDVYCVNTHLVGAPHDPHRPFGCNFHYALVIAASNSLKIH
jgi:hypothetical protein